MGPMAEVYKILISCIQFTSAFEEKIGFHRCMYIDRQATRLKGKFSIQLASGSEKSTSQQGQYDDECAVEPGP